MSRLSELSFMFSILSSCVNCMQIGFSTYPQAFRLNSPFIARCNITEFKPSALGFSVHFFVNSTAENDWTMTTPLGIYSNSSVTGKLKYIPGASIPFGTSQPGDYHAYPIYELKLNISSNADTDRLTFGCRLMFTEFTSGKPIDRVVSSNSWTVSSSQRLFSTLSLVLWSIFVALISTLICSMNKLRI